MCARDSCVASCVASCAWPRARGLVREIPSLPTPFYRASPFLPTHQPERAEGLSELREVQVARVVHVQLLPEEVGRV